MSLFVWACQQSAIPAAAPAAPAMPEPARSAAPAEPANARAFGAQWDDTVPEVSLAELLEQPAAHKGRRIRTSGTVARVCQAMGCWMELKETAGERTLRVPMAGHAFFLPKDAAGEHAVVQGEVVVQELSPEAQAHYRGEGMVATDQAISLHAQAVRLGQP